MSTQQTAPTARRSAATAPRELPMAALLALAAAVFITCLTETLPAGVLPEMSADLHVSTSAMGQAVTIYAVGTALTAIPLTAATARLPRKSLLLLTMAAFAAANTVTALSADYTLTMAARFVAGVASGLAWALLAGYARTIAPVHLQGRAIAVAMAGIPVALSLGVPAGTFLGRTSGWRVAFFAMTGLTVVLLGWLQAVSPDVPGEGAGGRLPVVRTLRVPGVVPVLFVTAVFVLAHNILYTYIATFLDRRGMGGSTGAVLLVFGAACLVSIWMVGRYVHRGARALVLAGTLLVGAGAAALAVPAHSLVLVYTAALLWGLGWGGVPSLLQTAVGDAGGELADVAQAMLVTLWNLATALGGILGGVLLDTAGTTSFPWSVMALLVPVLVTLAVARTHGFPVNRSAG